MVDEKVLEQRLTALEAARSLEPAARLQTRKPYPIGGRRGAFAHQPPDVRGRQRALKKRKASTFFCMPPSLGLFEMNWNLLCPVCSCVISSFRALKNLDSHCRCTNCRIDFVAALDDMIAVTFTVHPAVRRIAYHDPETLSVEDYTFRFRMAEEGLIPDGRSFASIKQMLGRGLTYLDPDETATLEVMAEAGALRGSSFDGDAGFVFAVDPSLPAAEQRISIRCDSEFLHAGRGHAGAGQSDLRTHKRRDNALRLRHHATAAGCRRGRRRCTSRPSSQASSS